MYATGAGFFNLYGYSNEEFEQVYLDSLTGDPEAIRRGQEIFMRDLVLLPVAWTGKDEAHASFLEIPISETANGDIYFRNFRAASA